MSLLQPLGLAFLSLLPIVVAFYILKLRRQNVPVSSTLLWDQVLRDLNANRPWQRLRRNLLLLLQLLIMLIAIFALARPYLLVQAQAGANSMIVLLDASASMNATDIAPNRLEIAKRQVSQMIDDLPEGQQMTLIRVAGTPQVLVSTSDDKTALHTAVNAIKPSGSRTNMADALTLALSLSKLRANTDIVLVSDGNLTDPDNIKALGAIPARVRYIPIGAPTTPGAPAPNQGITAFLARPSPDRIGEYEAYIRITNYDVKAVKLNLNVYADDKLAASKSVDVPPRQSIEDTFTDLPLGVRLLHATISGNEAGDQLPTDNEAWALATGSTQHRVLMVSDSNQFLEKALTVLPGIDLWKVALAGYKSAQAGGGNSSGGYDVTILDGIVPDPLPAGNLLIFNPQPGNSLIDINGSLQQPRITNWRRTDPLLRYIDLGNVKIEQAALAQTPGWGRMLIETDHNPLMVAGTYEGRRIVIFTFDLHKTTLPLQLPYPLLVANVIGWLTNGGAINTPSTEGGSRMLSAGQLLDIQPVAKADRVIVQKPDKSNVTIPVNGAPSLTFADTEQVGVYTIVHKAGNKELDTQYAVVNLTDERESNIAVQPSVALGNQNLSRSPSDVSVAREIWPWFALAALAFMLFEWWWYHQRG